MQTTGKQTKCNQVFSAAVSNLQEPLANQSGEYTFSFITGGCITPKMADSYVRTIPCKKTLRRAEKKEMTAAVTSHRNHGACRLANQTPDCYKIQAWLV